MAGFTILDYYKFAALATASYEPADGGQVLQSNISYTVEGPPNSTVH